MVSACRGKRKLQFISKKVAEQKLIDGVQANNFINWFSMLLSVFPAIIRGAATMPRTGHPSRNISDL
jgi:hypothetical protein